MGQGRARAISKEYMEHIKHERHDGTCDVSECKFKDGRIPDENKGELRRELARELARRVNQKVHKRVVKEGKEPCPMCDKPMAVTGENVVLGGVNVGTTWECRNSNCITWMMP